MALTETTSNFPILGNDSLWHPCYDRDMSPDDYRIALYFISAFSFAFALASAIAYAIRHERLPFVKRFPHSMLHAFMASIVTSTVLLLAIDTMYLATYSETIFSTTYALRFFNFTETGISWILHHSFMITMSVLPFLLGHVMYGHIHRYLSHHARNRHHIK